MIIPLIAKDPKANDFTCRDGEIESIWYIKERAWRRAPEYGSDLNTNVSGNLILAGTYPTANIRLPLQAGDKEKANLLLTGEISRVDPATAERLTQDIVRKSAEILLDLSTDLRRQGLFLLPFRFYTMTMMPDGSLSFPSPQAIALPCDYPPHPEITAYSVTEDTLTLAIRFPVRPHRLNITPDDDFPTGHSIRTFISYPLYIPDPKEMHGSIGSVRSAIGGNTTGIRLGFLSTSAIKASVAAPEKYYEMVGNERTGYRVSSKIAPTPDYASYADIYGYVPEFPCEAMLALGNDVDEATDPLDWIADWIKIGEGYLPISLPYKYRHPSEDYPSSDEEVALPDGMDTEEVSGVAESLDMPWILLTRPMAFASDSLSRRHAALQSIRSIKLHGLSQSPAYAVLYGSNDCRHWEAVRQIDPRIQSLILAPARLWWRLLLFSRRSFGAIALQIAL